MKRIFSLVLCAILLVTAIPFSVTAEGAKPQLVVNSAETTTAGGEVELTVRALNAADLSSARIWLKAAAPLKITGAVEAETLPDYVVLGPTEGEYAEGNGVTFEWASDKTLGSDDVALVTYTVSVPEGTAAGEYDVEIVVSDEDMLDKDQNEVAFEALSGKVTVVDDSTVPQLTVNSAETTTAGGEVSLTVRALNAADLSSARIWLKAAAPLKITGASSTAPDYVVIGPTEGEYAEKNGVTFEWASDKTLGSDDVALVTYIVSVPAGTAAGEYDVEIVVSDQDMLDKDQNEVVFKTVSGKVSVVESTNPQLVVDSAEITTAGGEVELTVRALNAADLSTALIWLKAEAPLKITGASSTAPDYVVIGPTEGEYADKNGVTFEWVSDKTLGSDDVVLVTYTISVPAGIAAGEYDVELVVSAEDMLDKDENAISFEIFSGKITVTETADKTYMLTGWSWSDDKTTVKAIFTCDTDPADVLTVSAVVKPVRTEPTCETAGSVLYTAKVTFGGKEYTDTRTEALEALGHAYDNGVWVWDGYSAAKVVFTCANDETHVESVDATITEDRTEPTPDEGGKVVYTAKAIFDGKEYIDTKTETLSPLGRTYTLTGWNWEDGTAQAIFTCDTDPSDVRTVDAEVAVSRTEPTCEVAGEVIYTAKVTFDGKEYTETKTEPLAAIGHVYGEGVWTWDGYGAAKVTITCANDASHVESVDATIDVKRTEPTCETAGSVVYTAKATFDGKEYTDTKTEPLAALGHAYGDGVWTWNGYGAAKIVFTCANDASHVESVDATIGVQRTEPTCETAGSAVYTAKATFDGKEYTDTKTESLAALGHAYGDGVWTWDGYGAAKVTITCANDVSHVESVDATIGVQRTEPTCETAGSAVYTAKATFDGKEYTDTKTEPLAALGHAYGSPEWTWDGFKAAKVTVTCANDASHKKTVDAVIESNVITEPSYVAPGSAVHTAKITVDGKEYTDVKTEVLPQKVHNYGAPTWTWSDDNSSVSVKFVGVDDPDDVVTLSAAVTSVRVEPTVDKEGSITYTAKITVMGKEYTDVKVVKIPKLDKVFEMSFNTIEAFENGKKVPGEIRVVDSEGIYSAKMTVDLPAGVSIESVTGIGGTAKMTKSIAKAGVTSVEITWMSAGEDVKGTESIVKIMFTLPKGTKLGDKLAVGLTVAESANKAGKKVLFEGKEGSIDFTHLFFDVNNDGKTTPKDVIATMRHMLKVQQSTFIFSRADTDFDGKVTAKDIISGMKYMLGAETATYYGRKK